MAAPTNLNDFYTGQGQKLPSLTERAKLYVTNGGQGNYMGTAQQNAYLLSKVAGGTSPTGTAVTFNNAPAAPAAPSTLTDWTNQNYGEVQSAQDRVAAARASLEDPNARYSRLAGETGITQEQQTIADLMRQLNGRQTALEDLPSQITDRVKDISTTLTEAQRARLVNSESSPIIKDISRLASAKSVEQQNLDMKNNTLKDRLSLADKEDINKLQPLLDQLGLTKDKFSAGQSAYSKDLDYRQSLEMAKLDAANKLALAKASKSSGGGSSNSSSTLKLANGKAFKVTQPVVTKAISILSDTPSDNPTENALPASQRDKYLSKNEAIKAANRLMATYGLDSDSAVQLLNQAMEAGGYSNWDELSDDEKNKILNN